MSTTRWFGVTSLGLLGLLLGAVGQAHAGIVFNNAADFSPTNNPSGVWSYGQIANGPTPVFSTFSLYTVPSTFGGSIENWSSTASFNPDDFYNSASTPTTFGTLTLQGHQAAFHPGPTGAYSVYRFTAPFTGSYSIAATFTASDNHGPAAPDPV